MPPKMKQIGYPTLKLNHHEYNDTTIRLHQLLRLNPSSFYFNFSTPEIDKIMPTR